MTSIVNFKENLSGRPSDTIFEILNRHHDAKLSDVADLDELSRIIVLAGDLYANKIKKGEVDKNDIQQTESFISPFIDQYSGEYLSRPHRGLDIASKMFIEGDSMALEKLEERNNYSSPLFDAETYERGFKKL